MPVTISDEDYRRYVRRDAKDAGKVLQGMMRDIADRAYYSNSPEEKDDLALDGFKSQLDEINAAMDAADAGGDYGNPLALINSLIETLRAVRKNARTGRA